MDLHLLRAFLVVAEERHVHRAAERLHLAQPTLSRQIAALERHLGVPLFSRARRRMALTPAGEVLVAGARDLVARSDDVARDVVRAHHGEVGTIRLGFVQSATFQALPAILRAFRAAHPDIVLDVRAMTSLRQAEALTADRIDVRLMRPQRPLPQVSPRTVSRDPLVAALPSSHPLADRDALPLSALADESFVLYARPSGPEVYDTIIGLCRETGGFSPRIVHEVPDVQTLVALVAADLGVSLLISPTPEHREGVVFRPLTDDLPRWQMVLAWSPERMAPVLARFLEVAGDVIPTLPNAAT
jgi:DNA-binding transcriptional LysR family regulator